MHRPTQAFSAVAAAALGACIVLAGAGASGSIPVSAAKAIRAAAGSSGYLPGALPSGYRYISWRNESPNQIPQDGSPWFMVTFSQGGTKLLWTITPVFLQPGEIGCSATSVGHTTVSGRKVYWGPLDTYETLGSGPKGRHVWRCIKAPGAGVGAIQLDAFDEHASIAVPTLAAILAHATSG